MEWIDLGPVAVRSARADLEPHHAVVWCPLVAAIDFELNLQLPSLVSVLLGLWPQRAPIEAPIAASVAAKNSSNVVLHQEWLSVLIRWVCEDSQNILAAH